MGKILAVCISKQKGTLKTAIDKGLMIEDFGLENDAHAGKWHRQISLLAVEAVRKFEAKYDFEVPVGAFGENLLVEGIDLKNLPIGTRLKSNDIELEITQIGKKCHLGCNIQQQTGECIMPHEGVFAVVLKGGTIQAEDIINILEEK